jgi:hypothetical protein
MSDAIGQIIANSFSEWLAGQTRDKETMIRYLLLMVSREDWHGVRDAAVDLEVMAAVERAKA